MEMISKEAVIQIINNLPTLHNTTEGGRMFMAYDSALKQIKSLPVYNYIKCKDCEFWNKTHDNCARYLPEDSCSYAQPKDYEPPEIDSDFGFDPFMGQFTDEV